MLLIAPALLVLSLLMLRMSLPLLEKVIRAHQSHQELSLKLLIELKLLKLGGLLEHFF